MKLIVPFSRPYKNDIQEQIHGTENASGSEEPMESYKHIQNDADAIGKKLCKLALIIKKIGKTGIADEQIEHTAVKPLVMKYGYYNKLARIK